MTKFHDMSFIDWFWTIIAIVVLVFCMFAAESFYDAARWEKQSQHHFTEQLVTTKEGVKTILVEENGEQKLILNSAPWPDNNRVFIVELIYEDENGQVKLDSCSIDQINQNRNDCPFMTLFSSHNGTNDIHVTVNVRDAYRHARIIR